MNWKKRLAARGLSYTPPPKETMKVEERVWDRALQQEKLNDMAQKTLIITSGINTIMFNDLDNNKELQIEVENGYGEYNSVYLDKENLISLREHLYYIIKKL